MKEVLAEFKLFSFLRKGLVSGSSTSEQGGEVNLELIIKRSEKGGSDTKGIEVDLKTYGPGDIIGIDQRLVVRTSPEKQVYDFETTNLVAIEFSRPDFPWMFTPEKPDQDKLMPWLVLIVVKTNEALVSNNPRNPLPILTINNVSEHNLPDLNIAWSYAHVQGDEDVTKSDIESNPEKILSKTPERLISRIVSPQGLESNEKYTAFLVPAYKAGVKAGLGEEFSGLQNEKAWTGLEHSLRLPIYYHWEFGTGEKGDFKTLVRQLKGRPLPEGVGTRKMNVQEPGAGLDFGIESVLFESALVPPEFTSRANTLKIKQELRSFLNSPSLQGTEGPVLGPPLYGNHQANRNNLHEDEVSRKWFSDLNEDPRHRATAALGTKVIQNDQEHLMHSAWEQVGDLKMVNEYFQQAQAARSAGAVLHKKHLSNLPVASFLQVTHTVQSRIVEKDSGHTVAHTIKSGRIPSAFFSGAFQCLLRPNGHFARRLYGENGLTGVSNLLNDLNTGRLKVEPDDSPPDGMVTPESVENPFPKKSLPKWLKRILAQIKKVSRVIGILLIIISLIAFNIEAEAFGVIVFVFIILLAYLHFWIEKWFQEEQMHENNAPESFTGDSIRDIDPPENFKIDIEDEGTAHNQPLPGEKFQEAAAKALDDLYFIPEEKRLGKEELNLDTIRQRVLEEIDPNHSIPKRVKARIDVPEHLLNPEDPIEPIRAAPYFPQPMYVALRDLSKDFILSGLDKIPRNSITIAEANRPFIESYMTGINHEMGRELLWRGFPTELRATYFQQFWDASDRLMLDEETEGENPASTKDVDYIHRWRKSLGEHPPVVEGNGGKISTTPLVLMIRGDLLRRYPNTVIYAVKAKKSQNDGSGKTERVPDDSGANNAKMPIFKGSMGSDISFFGFDLSSDEVLSKEEATNAPGQNLGWFFVLQEPVSDLSFEPSQGQTFSGIVASSVNAADVAKSIFKEPTLFAIHADGLIKNL
jgi:hypothetical protein